jgi:DNA-binding NarL/FixJ family response regulator
MNKSSKAPSTNWRLLIVEDEPNIASNLLEIVPTCVDSPDIAEADVCKKFSEAVDLLKSERFDVVILDLKDDTSVWFGAPDEDPAGLKVFEELKKTRFVPVIFYTAFTHKVLSEERSFVRVVNKSEPVTKVRDEVRRVLSTRLPALSRHIEELQRSYMWEFVDTHWKEFTSPHDQADIAYLLARRLALSLQTEARRLARKIAGRNLALADKANIHPMEMYVRPALSENRLAGDILMGEIGGTKGYWIVLTPSCDFEQKGRLDGVLLAQCVPLCDQIEFKKWKENECDDTLKVLRALLGDNRENTQSERFKYLPGTYFMPDSVVDFQLLQMVPPVEVVKLEVIASLDSPYAEALLARFSRYFGRLGTSDIDKTVVLNRLKELKSKSTSQDASANAPGSK